MSSNSSPASESIDVWGYVNPGTLIEDADSNRYVVEGQNAEGFLGLRNQCGGEHLAFEVLDQIDHSRFKVVTV